MKGSTKSSLKNLLLEKTVEERLAFLVKFLRAYKRCGKMKKRSKRPQNKQNLRKE